MIFYRVPLTIVNKAHQANQIYPYAISLIESIRTYERTLLKVIYFAFCFISSEYEYNKDKNTMYVTIFIVDRRSVEYCTTRSWSPEGGTHFSFRRYGSSMGII